MKLITVVLALITLSALVASPLRGAGIPQTINLQGRFTDAAGNNVADGVHTVDFKIWREPVAGALLWSETLPVQVTDGLFTVVIGNSTPIPADLFAGANRYLGVTVDAEPEMPRIPLNSVAYAYQTQDADVATLAVDLTCVGCVSASEVDPTEIQLRVTGVAPAGQYIARINQNGTVSTGVDANDIYTAGTGLTLGGNQFSISPNGVTSTEIATGAVLGGLAGDIADGTITADDLAASSVGSSEIDVAAVGSSEIATDGVLAPDIAAGAVGTSEVSDGSLTATDIDDEPGVASNTATFVDDIDMNGTVQNLRSRTITAPAAGYVLVIATAQIEIFHINSMADLAIFGVSATAGVLPANQDVAVGISSATPTGTFSLAVTVHGLFSTPGGADTYYFLGEELAGDLTTNDLQLTVIYFPTAHGVVVSTAAASGGEELRSQSGESGSLAPVAASGPSQTQVNADMEARVRKLEELLRQTQPRTDEQR